MDSGRLSGAKEQKYEDTILTEDTNREAKEKQEKKDDELQHRGKMMS